jgi:hypothetical protein
MDVTSEQPHKNWRPCVMSLGTQRRCTTAIGMIAQLTAHGQASWGIRHAGGGRAHAQARRPPPLAEVVSTATQDFLDAFRR